MVQQCLTALELKISFYTRSVQASVINNIFL